MDARRAYVAELLGAMLLLATIVGSGIMGQRMSPENAGVALLANALATGGVLYVLILGLGPISGGHFNPVVTLIEAASGRMSRARVPGYLLAQVGGGFIGVMLAHAMFGLEPLQHATHARSSSGEVLSEAVATFGLWLVISTSRRARPSTMPAAVALYITAAYWFTASTSFANPAVTLARSFTDTFSGIRLADAPLFIMIQLVGGGLAAAMSHWLTHSGVHPAPSATET